MIIYIKELILQEKDQPFIVGPVFNLLMNFSTLFDYHSFLARKHRSFRFIAPSHSQIYTADPVHVEYILKTNFSNYPKVINPRWYSILIICIGSSGNL